MKIRILALALTAMGLSPLAQAQSDNPIVAANNEIGIAATGSLLNYQEHLPSPSDTESGWRPGFEITASGMNSKIVPHLYLGLSYKYNQGTVTYHGALLTVPPLPITEGTPSITQQLMVKLGKGFFLNSDFMVTPYEADEKVAGIMDKTVQRGLERCVEPR